MRTTETILEMLRERGRQKKTVERLYRLLRNPDLLLTAYGRIAANKGAMTPGVDASDIPDGMSIDRINRLISALEQGSFHWKPVRRIYMPKAKGGKRPLGLPGFTDKLLQEAMRMLLEAYYEPRFSDRSHGFRPQRSCHTALEHLQHTCRGTKWWVEGDIQGCFDHIDHETLVNILNEDIKDQRFIRLVRQMLKAGYLENWRYHQTYSGTPQGGILSPLLTNIYLHKFDEYMERLIQEYKTPNPYRKINPEYNRYSILITKAKQRSDREEARRLAKAKRRLPVRDPLDPFIRVRYFRYADDFIVSVIGPKAVAIEVKQKMSNFLVEKLKLTLSKEKTLITHHSRKARFLGFNITINQDTQFINKDALGRIRRSRLGIVGLEVPKEVQVHWKRKYSRNGKPAPRLQLLNHDLHDIITAYGLELRGLYNYYAPAHNVAHRLYPLKWVMNQSLCKTLAAKLKSTVRQTARQFRYESEAIGLGYVTKRPGARPLYATFGTHSMRRKPFGSNLEVDNLRVAHLPRTQLVERLSANECEICASTEYIEVHHIRAMKDVQGKTAGWSQLMAEMRRKTLVVCRQCHTKIHAGQYDSVKLTKIT